MLEQTYSKELNNLLSDSHLPILLVFYTAYCGYSRLLDSMLKKVSNQMKQQLNIIKVDSEDYPDLANQYKIHALPTLLLFKKGKLVARIETESNENLMSPQRLIQCLQTLV